MVSKERALRALETAKRIKDTEAIASIESLLVTLQENENVSRNLAPRRDPGAFENITSGFGAGVVGIGEMASLGAATALEEEAETAARNSIRSAFGSIRPEGGDPDSISYQISQALGSIAGLASVPVAASVAGAPGLGALGIGALVAGSAGSGDASERARAAGATEEERSKASPVGFGIGLLDIVPIARVVKFVDMPLLTKLVDKLGPEKVESIGDRIYNAGATGVAEGLQEAASNVLQNFNEQEYNAAAETFGGAGKEALLGGSAGAILQGLVDLFASRRGGKTIGQTVDENKQDEQTETEELKRLEFNPTEPVQGKLFAEDQDLTKPETVINGEEIRTRVYKGFDKPFEQLTKKQQQTLTTRVLALSNEEFSALEKAIEDAPTTEDAEAIKARLFEGLDTDSFDGVATLPEEQRLEFTFRSQNLTKIEKKTLEDAARGIAPATETATEQGTLPGMTPGVDSPAIGPQLQGIPAPESEGRPPLRADGAKREADAKTGRDTKESQPIAVDKEGEAKTAIQQFEERKAKVIEDAARLQVSEQVDGIVPKDPAPEPSVGAARDKRDRELAQPSLDRGQIDMFPAETDIADRERRSASESSPIRNKVFGKLTKPYSELTEKQRKTVDAKIKKLPLAEQRTLEKELAETTATPEPVIATPEMLDSFGIPRKDPKAIALRSAVEGEDLTKPEPRAELEAFVGLKTTTGKAKSGINKFLRDVPSAQFELAKPTGRLPRPRPVLKKENTDGESDLPTTTERKPDPTGSRASDEAGVQSVGDPAGDKDTRKSVSPKPESVGDRGGSSGRPTGRKGTKPSALKKIVKKTVATKQTKQPVKEVKTKTKQPVEEVKTKAVPTEDRTPKETRADQESAAKNRLKAAKELAAKENISLEDAAKLIREMDNKGEVLFAPSRSTDAIDSPLPDSVVELLGNNELRRGLLELAKVTKDSRVSKIANKLANYAFDTRVEVVAPNKLGTRKNKAGEDVQVDGVFDSNTNTIMLNKDYSDVHIFLHEMSHAATISTLQNKSHPVTIKLTKLYEDTKEFLDSHYGSENVAEFVAEAFSNPQFQNELGRINPKGTLLSSWERFLDIISNFIGLGDYSSAKVKADRLIEEILAPAADSRYAPALESMTLPAAVRGINDSFKAARAKVKDKNLGENLAIEFKALFGGRQSPGSRKGERMFLGLAPNQAVQDIAVYSGMPEAKKLFDAIEKQRGDLTVAEQLTKKTLAPLFNDFQAKASKKTMDAWNNLVYDSTVDEVDPQIPSLAEAQKKYGRQPVEGTSQLKIDRYKELRKIYLGDTVGPKGRQAYTTLRGFYKEQYTALLDSLKGRIAGLDLEEGQKTTLTNELYAKMLEGAGKEPYFPLTRAGTYWLSVKDKDSANVGENSAVYAFEDGRQRLIAMEQFVEDGYEVEVFDPASKKTYENPPPGSFVAQVMGILNVQKVDPEIKEQITRLFIESLPETAFAKALVRRSNTAGFRRDALDAVRTKGYDLARQTERIKNSTRIQSIMDEVSESVATKNPELKGSALLAEMQDRAQFAVNPPPDNWAKIANRAAFVWTIGFNASSALVNLSQIPLFAYPNLAGTYGADQTFTAIKEATKLFGGAPSNKAQETLFGDSRTPRSVVEALKKGDLGAAKEAFGDKAIQSLDNYYTFKRNEKGDLTFSIRQDIDIPADVKTELEIIMPMMELASQRGQLNSSFIADTLNVDQSGRKLTSWDVATNASALMFHSAEVMNRQVTMAAAYKLELKKLAGNNKPTPEQQKQAAEEAIYQTQQINGGATLETGPRYARKGIGRVGLMYKSYGIQMYYTMSKSGLQVIRNLLPGDNAESRKLRNDALRQLAGVHLSALLFAGVQGLPLYGLVSMVLDWFDEDYEADTDTVLRSALNNDWLYSGAVSQITGIDISQRVKLTDLLFEADRFNSSPSPEETFFHYFGGPAWSVGLRFVEGGEKLLDGDILGGMEDMVPGAVRNLALGLFKYPMEGGIMTKRGDPIYDDLHVGNLLGKILGFPPTAYTRQMAETSAGKRMEIGAKDKRKKLLRRYYMAKNYGDYEEVRAIRKEMREFNKSRIASRIDPKLRIDGETIEKSMAANKRTTDNKIYNGVTLSNNMQKMLDKPGFFDD